MSYRSRNRDPYWITARYPGFCSETGDEFAKGDRVFYYPATKATLAGEAAERAAAEFEASVFDEAVYAGGCY